jgi:NAD(P)-dependent dehydrogenase (short-subunit alcohol dehydrogenase family)
MRLENKVAVITGCSSGIGRAMARRFAAEGAKLVAVDIWEDRLNKVVGELSAQGHEVVGVVADVTRDEDIVRMIDTAVERFGGVNILCNNAGVLDKLTPVHDADDDLFNKVMAVNAYGPFAACRRVLPIMLEAGGGSIVNTASAAGQHGGRGGAVYTMSKHAVVGLTRNVAWYYGNQGIRCNAIAPGQIMTRMASGTEAPHQGGFEHYQPYFTQMPTPGKSGQVADVALFLASDESSYVNGAILPADGGWTSF